MSDRSPQKAADPRSDPLRGSSATVHDVEESSCLTKEILEPPVALTRDAENGLRYQNPLLPRHRHRLRLAGQIKHVVVVPNALIGSREPRRRQQAMGLV